MMNALLCNYVLLCITVLDTKWNRRIRCPKSWWKVYNNINIWLKKFSGELFAKLEKDDLELDEVVSGFGKIDLVILEVKIQLLNSNMSYLPSKFS